MLFSFYKICFDDFQLVHYSSGLNVWKIDSWETSVFLYYLQYTAVIFTLQTSLDSHYYTNLYINFSDGS